MCRREINLLATQKAEIRRLHRLVSVTMTNISQRARMVCSLYFTVLPFAKESEQCRKTCARIKFVLNERRLALLNATARIHWTHRPGFKDPAKNPKTKLRRGPQMTEKQTNFKMRKL